MRSNAMILENFVGEKPRPAARPAVLQAEIDRQMTKARSEAHAHGYEEGAAAALAAYDSELKLLLAEIAESLADQGLTAREARAATLRALKPLMQALTRAISPALARAGLAHEISDRLDQALRASPEARIIISVAPDMLDRVSAALGPVPAELRADPDCRSLQARIAWAAGFDEIDLDACIDDVRQAMEAFLADLGTGSAEQATEGDRRHG